MTNTGLTHILNTLTDSTLSELYIELEFAQDELGDALDRLPASSARDELAKDADELRRFLSLVKAAKRARLRRQGDVK